MTQFHDIYSDEAVKAWNARLPTSFAFFAILLEEEGPEVGITPEGRIKHLVKKVLAGIPGSYQHWPVQNGMGSPTLDCIACVKGYYVAIETKAPGKKPTPRQEITMKSMQAAGALVFVVDSEQKVNDLENSLKMLQWIENADNY